MTNPVVICALDGLDRSLDLSPTETPLLCAALAAESMSLPDLGDSELGYRALGRGTTSLPVRNQVGAAMSAMELADHRAFADLMADVGDADSTLHILGLVGEGSSHGNLTQTIKLAEMAGLYDVPVVIHAVVDGQGIGSQAAGLALDHLDLILDENVKLGTVMGSHFALDDNGYWERTVAAFTAMVRDHPSDLPTRCAEDAFEALHVAYAQGYSDATIPPTRIGDYLGVAGETSSLFGSQQPQWLWRSSDFMLLALSRTDRIRQLTSLLLAENCPPHVKAQVLTEHGRGVVPFAPEQVRPLVSYPDDNELRPMFSVDAHSAPTLPETLVARLAAAGRRTLMVSEPSRSQHQKHYFAGGAAGPLIAGEIVGGNYLVDSHAEDPDMRAVVIADRVVAALQDPTPPDLIVASFTNLEVLSRVGTHTEVREAALCLEACLARISDAAAAIAAVTIVTSAHAQTQHADPALGEPPETRPRLPFYVLGKNTSPWTIDSWLDVNRALATHFDLATSTAPEPVGSG